MDINKKIGKHLNRYNDYDIRKTRSGQYIDQKVTPDVLATVADCILNFVGQETNQEFTRKDIQHSDYSNNYVGMIFSKPKTDNPSAASEYDKYFGQPLQTLAHAHILNATKKGKPWYYTIENYELLEYIATKDFFAFNFLSHFLEKFLTASGFFRHITAYKDLWERGQLTKTHFADLRNRWDMFLIGNTPKNGRTESHRIWAKVLNTFAVRHHMPGSDGGFLSTHAFTFNDLLYNRLNWRDLGKDKKLTRKEAERVGREQRAERYRDLTPNYVPHSIRELSTCSVVYCWN
ncbi:MAG: hypothetical protein FVQ80_03950 [Planctomycetes bacterium]|nr:hypothetical protein [Planctomycetota bacterium]